MAWLPFPGRRQSRRKKENDEPATDALAWHNHDFLRKRFRTRGVPRSRGRLGFAGEEPLFRR